MFKKTKMVVAGVVVAGVVCTGCYVYGQVTAGEKRLKELEASNEMQKQYIEQLKAQDIKYEKLEIEGVVFTMYDARTNLSLQVVENVKDNLDTVIYKTIIPRNIRLAEAPSHGLPINLYDPKSTGAESYMLLAEEVIHKGEEE